MRCERFDTCVFFRDHMEHMPAVAALMRQEFCATDKMSCARYKVLLSGITVPRDLLPNDQDRARSIIERGKTE